VPVINGTLDAPDANDGLPEKYAVMLLGTAMVILPLIGTSTPGVNTRTGNTPELTPLEARLKEVKVAAATIAGEDSCWVPARAEVDNEKTPAPVADPRVKPESVMMTELTPVAAPAVVIMIWVLVAVTAAAEPVIEPMLVAVAANIAVPVK